ncbi:MAG TPA: metallopeptidase family protein [Kofleriaceae bacterium]|jgi:predicted Zn-dependent protease with MMP-like domain/Tfp pilus assembly protein PilF|nr:metallopeptidase family protein [Kofleriaceae bacterium]
MSRTERLHTDLERGFAALEAGELDTASSIVERCRRIDRKNPDVVALAAAVADTSGDTDDALAQYRLLRELRPDDPMPIICIARLELQAQDDPDAALDTLAAAFDFIDEEADLIEAIYVKAQALVARGEPAAAREALAELASSAISDGDLALDLAELALAADDPAAAQRWIEIARADSELTADALHLLGQVHEATGDRPAMIAAWQEVRRLDLAAGSGPLEISEDDVEQIALQTLAELPEDIRARLTNVPILIDSAPSEALVADGLDPRLLGLFQGTPMSEDGGLAPTVTNILLFRGNLARACSDAEHLAEEIRITVLHETAHYFGLDEDDLEALGLD